ncbi:MAG: sodium:calcium antiporter [Bacilli bacterium]
MIYALYVVLLVAVVYLSMKLGDFVDLLDKKTNISGAFIGGVMLAAVTSLPELFTSGSAVLLVGENDLVLGNIFGSNIFNMIVIAIGVLVFFKGFKKSKISSWHIVLLSVTGAFYLLSAFAIFFPNIQLIFTFYIPGIDKNFGFFNIVSFLILLTYIILILKQPKTKEDEDEEKEETESKLTVKQIVVLFVICAVLLIGVSIAITYVTDIVADKLGLGKTVAGAILLGVATSLPELVSCLTLMRKQNFDAAFGDITGSNLFNFTILGIADLLSVHNSVYTNNSEVILFLICTTVSLVCLFTVVLVKSKKGEMQSNKWAFLFIPLSIIILASYICSIAFNII